MKNISLTILFSILLISTINGQLVYPAFDNSSSGISAIMYSDLKIKTNQNLIIGNLYNSTGSLGVNNGRLRFHTPLNFGHSFLDFQHNFYIRAEAKPMVSSLALYKDGIVGINMGISNTPNSLHSFTEKGHKLLVNGSILCEKIKVILDVPNSDDVFEDNYTLRPLNEVESFINTNKHLPEIPSAEEFKKTGYNVGEMDNLLLRKVEELTLYIIELEKKIKDLERKL